MRIIGVLLLSGATLGQAPSDSFQSVATMSQLMVDIIHPAANDILLFVNRGDFSDENQWTSVRRSAVTLAESGNLLMMRAAQSIKAIGLKMQPCSWMLERPRTKQHGPRI